MFFLHGDRIYIKPKHACGTVHDQLEDCLQQVRQINSGKKIFKLNYFVDTKSDLDYSNLVKDIQSSVDALFTETFVQNFIAQPPLTCKIVIEAFYYDPSIWDMKIISVDNGNAAIFEKGDSRFLIGTVQSNADASCKINSEHTFADLSNLLSQAKMGMSNIIRQWNYLENILGFDGEEQRYQEFNNVRSKYYGDAFLENGYPAATGIGMNRGGVIIEFVAVDSNEVVSKPVDNPGQISAHKYSEKVLVGDECVLKTTPKFERARYFQVMDKKQILISGTASIIGEKTMGVDDPVMQTEVTIENIQRLYSDEILKSVSTNGALEPKYGHARVYVKHRKDFPEIRRTFKKHYGTLPVVYIIADICRNDLLVEIEGKVVLE